mmetsp:Transcript_27725/g.74610  ORF Transcript_27725/g.74610 Transcript_27725/m.74610 type:complete len:287 (-) Transcript_27725:1785-2645(-)
MQEHSANLRERHGADGEAKTAVEPGGGPPEAHRRVNDVDHGGEEHGVVHPQLPGEAGPPVHRVLGDGGDNNEGDRNGAQGRLEHGIGAHEVEEAVLRGHGDEHAGRAGDVEHGEDVTGDHALRICEPAHGVPHLCEGLREEEDEHEHHRRQARAAHHAGEDAGCARRLAHGDLDGLLEGGGRARARNHEVRGRLVVIVVGGRSRGGSDDNGHVSGVIVRARGASSPLALGGDREEGSVKDLGPRAPRGALTGAAPSRLHATRARQALDGAEVLRPRLRAPSLSDGG